MKNMYIISILIFLITSCEEPSKNECFPDKGIKIAISTAEMGSGGNEMGSQEIYYDEEGRPLLVRNTQKGGAETRWEYVDGKLQFIIVKRKDLPSFYRKDELDSLIANASEYVDTAVIISHTEDGRPLELKGPDGTMLFEYIGCDKRIETLIGPDGETIQQTQSIHKGNVLVESKWTLYKPDNLNSTTPYYGYKFNDKGHWIERKYDRGGVVTERRELIYY